MTVVMMGLAHPHEKPTGKDNKSKARAGETMGEPKDGAGDGDRNGATLSSEGKKKRNWKPRAFPHRE